MSSQTLITSVHSNAINEFNRIKKKTKKHKDLEKKVIEAILRYIIENRYRPWMLTLRGMEKGIGLNYSKLRSLLLMLIKERILTRIPVGNTYLFSILNLSKALEKGYLRFSSEELSVILSLATPLNIRIKGTLLGDELLKSLPIFIQWPDVYDQISTVMEKIFERASSIRGVYGQMVYLSIPLYKTLLTEFEYPEEFTERFRKELKVEEPVEMERFVPLAYNIFIRETFFELDCKLSPSEDEILEALGRVFEKQLKLLIYFSDLLISEIQNKSPSEEFLNFRIRSEIAVLRFAITCLKLVNMNSRLIEEAEKKLEILKNLLRGEKKYDAI